ncbi:MAG: agmatinase family protein [Sphingobacteriales bacterium]|jgi:agmatinase|nr:agmatinase family protein [Sphingobacteriales bacterium]
MSTSRSASSRERKVKSFDPNGPALDDAGVFGLPFTTEESSLVLVPIPWEATVSYGRGTADGPQAILDSSMQVDLFHPEFPELWKLGVAMDKAPAGLRKLSDKSRKKAEKVIDGVSSGLSVGSPVVSKLLREVNSACESMVSTVQNAVSVHLDAKKLVGLVGGDHSTPLGYMKALAERYPDFGILQIDAHMDLRNAYEGFAYSHASIMYNALRIPQVSKLVQLGIRDSCIEEQNVVKKSKGRVKVFTYADVARNRYAGMNWKKQCNDIIAALPKNVYISFDIDGLDPKLCPNTGTPVAGGFEFHEITFLLSLLANSGKRIIGFDLNEVAPGKTDWDGNVGARMLFHLCGVIARSNRLL